MPVVPLIARRWVVAVAVMVVILLMPAAWPIHGLTAFLVSVALRLAVIAILLYHLGRIFFQRHGWHVPHAP